MIWKRTHGFILNIFNFIMEFSVFFHLFHSKQHLDFLGFFLNLPAAVIAWLKTLVKFPYKGKTKIRLLIKWSQNLNTHTVIMVWQFGLNCIESILLLEFWLSIQCSTRLWDLSPRDCLVQSSLAAVNF